MSLTRPDVTGPAALSAHDLTAGYRRWRRAIPIVHAACLEARRGELTAVVGPNGSGKSTLLRTLVGAQPPLDGQVHIDGRDLRRIGRPARARHLAVVLTDRVEPGLFTVGDMVALGRHPYTGWHGRLDSTDQAAVRRAGETVGISALWDQPFGELSDGQRQRVMLARALAQEPAVLVLDEPTAFLDVPGRVTLTVLLTRLATETGVAVVLSTHDLDLALGHAGQVWLVHEGQVRSGAPRDLVEEGTLVAALDQGDANLRAHLTRMVELTIGRARSP